MSGLELKIVTKESLLNAQIESKRRNNGGFLGGVVTRELNQAAVSLKAVGRASDNPYGDVCAICGSSFDLD